MGGKMSKMLCLMVFLCISRSPCAVFSLLLNDDVLGLIVFKADLQDPTSALASWNEDDNSPCSWRGVACRLSDGRVVNVSLDGLALSGRLGRGLARLELLQTLSVSNNNITGDINTALPQLITSLTHLDLSNNGLSGFLPPSLANFSALQYLDLSGNFLSGPVPHYLFANCGSLTYLSLAKNSLQGSLPPSIASCPNLAMLNFSNNLLTGELPVEVGILPALRTLDVSFNSFYGSIPLCASLQRKLSTLELQGNSFSGSIPDRLSACTGLIKLDLSYNSLSEEIPSSLQSLRLLSTLKLEENSLSGEIPSWLLALPSLQILSVARNLFTGSIPATTPVATLQFLDVSSNHLSDAVPKEIFSAQLRFLQLSNNRFNSQLPPDSFKNCAKMQVLDLSQNQFTGALPPLGISNCPNLEYLNVSLNGFSGVAVKELSQIPSILVIDLSNNIISQSIPASVGSAKKLRILLLSRNKIAGIIPAELANCSSLTSLSLSHNNVSGHIPAGLGNLAALQHLDLSFNHLSGAIPPELGLLGNLTMINLSYNKLTGPVPSGGVFNMLNKAAFSGNEGLCGADVNVTCPSVMPKPIVLNPGPESGVGILSPLVNQRHGRVGGLVLSPSACIAVAAAVMITLGIFIVVFLNVRAQANRNSPHHNHNYNNNSNSLTPSDSLSQSPSAELSVGKLVMFNKSSDPRSEEWVASAHALLNKGSEVGRGGFGTVYKAVLADGRTVAVKKLMLSSLVKSQEEFEKEVQVLGWNKHRNLVGMKGYYWTPQLQLLIYDFVPHGNLYSRLHEKTQGKGESQSSLSWMNRFRISLGIARGLAHLHHACEPQIIHYNLKSSNVLIDANFVPKIADYGLAKLLPMLDRYIMSSKFQSALGYMAPEFACQSLKINEKCDVYGYGVILLELVTGRRPVEYMEDDVVILCDYVRSLLEEGKAMSCVDPSISSDYTEDEVLPVIKLGLLCTSQVPSNRPSMSEVVQILELIKTPAGSRVLA